MRVLQYNIWNGCHDQDRYKMLKYFLNKQSYDVISFNELKYWSTTSFAEEMKKLGYEYTVFLGMSSSPYSMGIAAKTPIEEIMRKEDDPFHHGMLHVRMTGIDWVVTHLSPFSAAHREEETSYIANYMKCINRPAILMGDLNTLSPLDDIYYEKTGLRKRLNAHENSRQRHIKNEKINYEPMRNLLESGLHDIGRSEELDFSMPTKVHGEIENPRHVRIDYMLVNDQLLTHKPQAHVIRSSEVDTISDHYPVEGQLDL